MKLHNIYFYQFIDKSVVLVDNAGTSDICIYHYKTINEAYMSFNPAIYNYIDFVKVVNK